MSTREATGAQDATKTPRKSTGVDVGVDPSNMDSPSLDVIISSLAPSSPAAAPSGSESLPLEEQKALLSALQDILRNAEAGGQITKASDAQDSTSSAQVGPDFETVRGILDKLWACSSHLMVQAAELLANGSRNSSWRYAYGRAGILGFFLQLIASHEAIDNSLILHSLRLVGNSCADADENRALVVDGNYTAAIVRHSLNPELINVVIPVVYNTCIDYEPAQAQLAANRIVYILLSLITKGVFKENEALLDFVYELIDLTGEQEQSIENLPIGTISLLTALALDTTATAKPMHFACLVNCLMAYLENARFQEACISKHMVPDLLSILQRSITIRTDASDEDIQTLAQLQLKINQTLSEVSASPSFTTVYPLDSTLTKTLASWLSTADDQLQICSCVMLGNLARSDEACEKIVRDLQIHQKLIDILKSDARGSVLHSSLGFLKNLAIAGDNKLRLGEAGIVPAISRLWAYDTVPQVQFAAISLTRQLLISSKENISRVLATVPSDEASSDPSHTYLSLLLSAFEKTDSTPIKIEVGRIIASLCRSILTASRDQDAPTDDLHERLFGPHERVSLPLGAMVTQTQWPVVRSEGWFALALMASRKPGAGAVIHCMETMDLFPILEETVNSGVSGSTEKTENPQLNKDCENIIILVQELAKSESDALSTSHRDLIENIKIDQIPRYLAASRQS
ncbi:putative GTP binding protein [Aspergillus candidus]|uniref:GTP-binding protein n=1 Tax=Aspergillus candidus TaxID=41067 RepID=A0A2I2F8N8_ASPCN|nr:GTP-binding protein [Aspergillus candidus]PLB36983.1 GTP-binding protein [Aspergillus candidus]